MAQLKSIKLRGGFTINMGNFESAKIEAEVELVAEEGETSDDVFNQARELVDAEIGKQVKSLKKLKMVKENQSGLILDVVKVDDVL